MKTPPKPPLEQGGTGHVSGGGIGKNEITM